MNRFCILLTVCALSNLSSASWYWPFGDDDEEKKQPRVSELMEPASVLIDDASDLAASGKISEAVEKYKRALEELDRIESENADRARSTAFATIRNKRAYVNAAIDSLHLKEAKQNARAVTVSDTTELEKKFAQKKGLVMPSAKEEVKSPAKAPAKVADDALAATPAKTPAKASEPPQSLDRRGRLVLAAEDIKAKDYDAASLTIAALLAERPDDSAALILRAAMEAEQGAMKKAERTLDQVIRSHPRDYHAYYNMARLFMRARGRDGAASAKRYYETGRSFGGPVDSSLEAMFQ